MLRGQSLPSNTHIKIADVLSMADSKPGTRGVRRLRSVLKLVDGGAESPQESRVRMLFMRAGLPAPETQIEFADEFGDVRIRVEKRNDAMLRDCETAAKRRGFAQIRLPQQVHASVFAR